MSKIQQAIMKCISSISYKADGEITAWFIFSADFIGFNGHFPERPILPGVCEILAILCILESSTQKAVRLKEISSAKFFAPITCSEEVCVIVRKPQEVNDEGVIKALIVKGDTKIAEIRLRVVFDA